MIRKISIFVVVMLCFCCQEDSGVQKIQKHQGIFTRSVGGPISPDIAAKWVERKRSHLVGRETNFSVSAENLNILLAATDDKLGVILHHAQDGNGSEHLFITPVKADLLSWTNGMVLDAASNTFIDEKLASNSVSTYKSEHPEGPWSHFYGIDLFNEISSIDGFSELEIRAGEREDGQSPLLLYVWSDSQNATGRVQGQETVYDNGAICPTACPN